MKTGIMIEASEELRVYNGIGASLISKFTGKKMKKAKVLEGTVKVSNKFVTVIVNSDGNVEVQPHEQLLDD